MMAAEAQKKSPSLLFLYFRQNRVFGDSQLSIGFRPEALFRCQIGGT